MDPAVTQLARQAQRLWSDRHAVSADYIKASLARAFEQFHQSAQIDREAASTFLETAAHIIYAFYNEPAVVSSAVMICGLLLIGDPWHEYQKKRIILSQFATLVDLIALTRVALDRTENSETPADVTRVLATFSSLIAEKISRTKVPNTFRETLDYIAGTLEYFAFMPNELDVFGDDFLPDPFLGQLEERMSHYTQLHRLTIM